MTIITTLHHVTHYTYDKPVALGPQTIRLRPAAHTKAHIQSYSLNITPTQHFINWQQDPFGNYLARVVFPEKTKEFRVEVDVVSEIRVFNPFDFFVEDYAHDFPFAYETNLKEELAPYLEIKENGALLTKWLASVPKNKQPIVDFLVSINAFLHKALRYGVRLEPGIQSCEETLKLKSGSCRDMAWLLCQALRHRGLASRFVSGYLIQLAPDVKSLDGPSGTEVDFTDLHAWTEVYIPGAGWIGLDPTSGLFAGESHIPLCCTPNPSSAAPISGAIEPCNSSMQHEMTITRIHEARRVTKPYSESEWKAIDALGVRVEKDLVKRDVRLTMGGEPTFVSLDDPEGEAWNFTALSEDKTTFGHTMLLKLAEQFAKGGLLQYTQGKWYPGELLPRWAMHCFWRRDGEALWKAPTLLANPQQKSKLPANASEKFLKSLAEALAIPGKYVRPAYEDTSYYLWKEQRIPITKEIASADLHEASERKRLQNLLDNNLSEVVGYVLPLHHSPTRKRWISNRWKFKAGQLFLLPGDSPVGLRLPLGNLPSPSEAASEFVPTRDPAEQNTHLPTKAALQKALSKRHVDDAPFKNDVNGLIKSAICTQLRDGNVHIFLPPISLIEHFLELIAAIEQVAATLKIPVVLEGYSPPKDVRLQNFSVTPDPGVLEINIQPAASWGELTHITRTVYEQARLARLTTDKFLLDGRRVGTGGGNHVVIGAATPEDSPFLRRPDLLRSMLSFWQNHPSLSYLFSGMYIGPTSQSPRIDEARHDAMMELEIAFQQLEKEKKKTPWLVDRLFRNLLVDITGNTHRAEFCIDKLYSPDSATGRLGLLEMRGFEMTPHPEMNLLQALLVRACIAQFWKTPYTQPLIRWGTQLHDRFMLSHFIAEDLRDVLRYLSAGGYDFSYEWFAPFMEFRFPHYGAAHIGDVRLDVRMALEPWPVMGEASQASGTSRAVDSSVERVEIKVTGATPGRHIITCNGHTVPLTPTAEQGVMVAGIRFKAWKQPSSLHPNVPVHTPLVFDVIDSIAERSLGGCRYHVMHPGGRNYETIPINANEAEGRRLSRFQTMGHTPGRLVPTPLVPNPDFPLTLDLRRQP